MVLRLHLLFCLTLCNLYSRADWIPKCSSSGWNSLIFKNIFYLNDHEGFANGGLGFMYHTENNWTNYEQFATNIPAQEHVEYLEMTSSTKGVIVTRRVYALGNDSSFIYLTENGGYHWQKVFTLPIPKPSIRWEIGVEDLFFQRKGNQLFILFGDIICYGKMNGKQWNIVKYPYSRDMYNTSFGILNDSIWSIQFGADKFYTNNKGKTWRVYLTDPAIGQFGSGLGNSIQRIYTHDFSTYSIEEYSSKDKTWSVLNSKFAMDPNGVVQLSNNYLLIAYYYWPVSKIVHSVYDRNNNRWIDLDTLSNFFDLKKWTVKGNDFVTLSWDGRIMETKDFGQTWQAVISNKPSKMVHPVFLSFNKNMGVAISGYDDFLFSTNSGEKWRHIDSKSITSQLNLTPPAFLSLSHDNDAELYLMADKVWKIMPEKDSFNLVETGFTFKDSLVNCINISNKWQMGFFVLAIYKDSLFLFNSTQKGELTRLHAQKDPGQNGRNDRLLIQNKNYVVFSAGKSIFCYYKKNGQVAILTDSLFNSVYSLDFATEDIVAAGAYLETFFYNFTTNTPTSIKHFKHDLMKYGVINSMASDGKGGLLLGNDNVLYTTTLDSFGKFVLDLTFKDDTYTEIVRYWNEHYWAGSFWNIYKNEKSKEPEILPCIHIETLWPNPFHNEFTVQLKVDKSTSIHFQCYNSIGQLIKNVEEKFEKGVYDKNIDIGNGVKGFYYLKVSGECGIENCKLIRY